MIPTREAEEAAIPEDEEANDLQLNKAIEILKSMIKAEKNG